MCPSPRSHHVIFNTCAFANRQLAPLLNRLFYSIPPVNNHRRGSSRLIRAPVLVVDLLTSLGVTPPPCPVTPAEYLLNQPYGAHADSNRIVNMQLCVVCKSFYGCSASMLISALNKKADLLSRHADHDMGKDDNKDVVLLKPEYFRAEYI